MKSSTREKLLQCRRPRVDIAHRLEHALELHQHVVSLVTTDTETTGSADRGEPHSIRGPTREAQAPCQPFFSRPLCFLFDGRIALKKGPHLLGGVEGQSHKKEREKLLVVLAVPGHSWEALGTTVARFGHSGALLGALWALLGRS